MNKLTTAVLGLAVAAIPVFAATPAFAQDERDCNRAQREAARVELRLAGLVTDEREAERAALEAAQKALDAAQAEVARLVAANAARDVIQAARAVVDTAREARDAARDALNTDSRRLVDLRAELAAAVKDRDKACDEPDPTPTPTPTTTPTTPPPDNDVDCTEVSDARAQEILNADRSDPNNLDEDNDGVACEDDVIIDRDVVVVPNGGVNTGGWKK